MSYILGMLLAAASIFAAINFLHLDPTDFFDDVAAAIVFGGTIAIGFVIMPWEHTRVLFSSLIKLVFFPRTNAQQVVDEGVRFLIARQQGLPYRSFLKGPVRDVLEEGKELLDLGFNQDDIREILEERLDQLHARTTAISNSVRSLAKYPPAFGLIGTVLGLVELMRAITEGLNPAETGGKMAIALMATLYGLIVANLVVAPIGESIVKRDRHEQWLAELMVHTLVLAAASTPLVKAQEILNSYLPKKRRQDRLHQLFASEDDAA
jgi:chemotaxis protein MotA